MAEQFTIHKFDKQTFLDIVRSTEATLNDLVVGFVSVRRAPSRSGGQREDVGLVGSGTLVKSDQVYGILTAAHVIDTLMKEEKVGLILPSRVRTEILHPIIDVRRWDRILFAPKDRRSNRPDIGILILPIEVAGTLKAKKTFYDLGKRQTRMLMQPEPIDHGFWILSGLAGEWVKDIPGDKGFSMAREFRGLHGAGGKVRDDRRAKSTVGFDYLLNGVLYNRHYDGPDDYGGSSGGALWQVLVEVKGGNPQAMEPLLSGVAFFQYKKRVRKQRVTRQIACHGRQSIYKVLLEAVRQKYRTH